MQVRKNRHIATIKISHFRITNGLNEKTTVTIILLQKYIKKIIIVIIFRSLRREHGLSMLNNYLLLADNADLKIV
jgi:hypothetical protein